jgi:WD40 repeat protein
MTDSSTAGAETEFTVFISSPSDVDDERDHVKSVLTELNTEFAGRFRFNPISWPDGYYTANKDFQPQIPPPSKCHIVICVLWSRLGSPLPPQYDRPDGTSRTGTEWEFEDALQAALDHDGIPDILVYRKTKEDLTVKAGKIDDQQAQLRALDAFWRRWFRDEQGHFIAGFDTFEDVDDFSEKLKRHIRLWLEDKIKRTRWSIELQGSPYRRLESFDLQYAEVFFGRRRAIRQVIARLQTRAIDGCAFLVVMGMSGVGKSSMVKAGVVPWLIKGLIPSSVDEWRSCVLRCDALVDDPALVLAEALFDKDCLPELADGDYASPEALATLTRGAPELSASPITAALRRAGTAIGAKKKLTRTAKVQLVVVFDQLEILLLGPETARTQAIALMDALARSGGSIYVIATLRSDFYPKLQANAALLALKDDGASFDLAPPTPLEINDIIEGPARAAGLGLQQDGERDLATLLNAAAAKPGSLPMLEFTLSSLFEERDQASNLLLLKTYADLGGLEGAIAVEAERLVKDWSVRLRDALPDLLLALVDIDETRGVASASARTISRSQVTDASQNEVADRLVEGRFLIADQGAGGATLRLAHDALMAHWPRLSELIAAESRFLGTRRRLERDAQIWQLKERHPDFLLPVGQRLVEAASLLRSRSANLDEPIQDYIRTSNEAAEAKLAIEGARNRQRLLVQSAAGAAVLVLAVIAGLVIASQQRNERVAVANDRVDRLLASSRYSVVIPLATAALPPPVWGGPSVGEQELIAKLQYALDRNRLVLAIGGFDHKPNQIAFDRAGDRILALSSGGELGVWDATTGARLLAYEDRKIGCCAAFDAVGGHVVAIAARGAAPQVINVSTGASQPLLGASSKITTLSADPSGAVLVAGASDGVVQIWNAASLARVANLATDGGPVKAVAYCAKDRWFEIFSRDGKARRYGFDGTLGPVTLVGAVPLYNGVVSASCSRLAAASNRMLWSWSVGGVPTLIQSGQNIDALAINSTGDRIVTASNDGETADLWDAASGTRVTTVPSAARIQSVAFDPVDGRLAVASFDDWVEVREGETGAALPGNLVLRDGAAFNRQVVFAPGGDRVATVAEVQARSQTAIRIWDVRVQSPAPPGGGLGLLEVGAPVRRVAFSPDRKWIATASADGLVHFWDASTLVRNSALDFIHEAKSVFDVAFDPRGPRVATASADGNASIWSLADRKLMVHLQTPVPVGGRASSAIYVAFDPKRPELVCAFADTVSQTGQALIDDQASGREEGRPMLESGGRVGREVWSASFDSTGQRIVTASENQTAEIWDAISGRPLYPPLRGHTAAVNWAGFSHHGDKVITVSDDGTARLWDVATGQPIGGPLKNDPAGMVLMAAFNRDDSEVVTTTSTGRLYYWDVATQKLLGIRMLGRGNENLFGIDFDPNGGRIAVASHDGTVQVIAAGIDPEATVAAARALVKRVHPKLPQG